MNLDNGMSYLDPVLDFGNAYAAGDQIGAGAYEVTNVLHDRDGMCFIESLTVEDATKQHAKLNILFFSAAPTVASANNAALDISAAEMKAKFIGHVSILDTDYVDLATGSYATLRAVALPLYNSVRTGGQANPKLSVWVAVQAQGAATYVAATDLRIKFSPFRA